MSQIVSIATPEVVADAEAKRLLSDVIEIGLQAIKGAESGVGGVCVLRPGEIGVRVKCVRYRIVIEQDL